MKNSTLKLSLVIAVSLLGKTDTVFSQTQIVTLVVDSTHQTNSFNFTTNQTVTVLAYDTTATGSSYSSIIMRFANGAFVQTTVNPLKLGSVYTGVTNISLTFISASFLVTLGVSTPTANTMMPANAVVIPTDANGPVQIILESSGDLVNWTSALPGTYGNTYSNRFFRVRALAQ